MIAYFIELPHNFESPELPQGLRTKIYFIPNHRAEPAFPNRFPILIQFRSRSFDNQFDPPVRQISHDSRQFKARR